MFDGELPGGESREMFAREVAPLAKLPDGLEPILRQIVDVAEKVPPLDDLRTAVSMLGTAKQMRATRDLSASEARRDALTIAAAIPTLAAALYRLRRGEQPVVTSTGADVAGAVAAAIAALSGPLHGGAPSRALDTLDAIGTPDRAEDFIREAIEAGDRIMGFGHRVYKTLDPRSELMKETARELGSPLTAFAEEVEARVIRLLKELKPDRQLYTNVEFYAGVVMDGCRVPREMFTPTFAVSRVIGWCAHILEQAADNRIIRPASRYVGPPPPQPVPGIASVR